MIKLFFDFSYLVSAAIAAPLRFRITVEGADQKHQGPFLVLGKHVSYWDIQLLSIGLRRIAPGAYPHFEMASFHGYPVLENLSWFLDANGGFPVMRPKDLIRLKRAGRTDKEELKALMQQVNEAAAATRLRVFGEGQAVCFFPEGTRDAERVLPFKSTHEIEEAMAFRGQDGRPVTLLPILPCYGRKPASFFRRRRVIIKILPPIDPRGLDAQAVMEKGQALFEANWVPPDLVDAGP